MSEQSFNQSLEDEISLKDIIDFLLESWKTIVGVGLLGVLGSVGFLAVTPNQYEAVAQIQMAQITIGNPAAPSLIEDGNSLIARMKLPSSYDQKSIDACQLSDEKNPQSQLSKLAKFSVIKGTQIVELKVTALSSTSATKCAEILVDQIKQYQSQIANIFISEANLKISNYHKRLREAQTFITKADKSGSSISATYLSTRDEIKNITDEIIRLNDLVSSANSRQTKLVSPIYSPENKIAPKRAISLFVGLMGGLFLGLVLTMGLRAYRSYNASSQ
jgi:LPS O-antigen subunit length determinant protein (WzzB/FepE family)